uniref:Uncharacterized protein n=1 Tax=Arundo donax TaxID=35708 RepID=A0A0A9G2Q9_ARUDO
MMIEVAARLWSMGLTTWRGEELSRGRRGEDQSMNQQLLYQSMNNFAILQDQSMHQKLIPWPTR